MSYKLIGVAALAVAVSGTVVLPARAATPTPMPGGAYQIKGVTSTLHATIFNGKLRFKKFVLRTSTPAEATPDPGGMALTLTYIVSDGIPKNIYGNVSATIAVSIALKKIQNPEG